MTNVSIIIILYEALLVIVAMLYAPLSVTKVKHGNNDIICDLIKANSVKFSSTNT